VFQTFDFMCNTVCSLQHKVFYLYAFHQCMNNMSLILFRYNLTVCLKIWKIYCRWVYESPAVKNWNVTANPSWTGTGATNLVTLFTIFGPTKLINTLKVCWCHYSKFLYRQINSLHFKSANKLVPMHCYRHFRFESWLGPASQVQALNGLKETNSWLSMT
jgi:hypothetical protein